MNYPAEVLDDLLFYRFGHMSNIAGVRGWLFFAGIRELVLSLQGEALEKSISVT